MPIRTGTSEKSNFKKGGKNGNGISRYISTTAIAVKIAAEAMRLVIFEVDLRVGIRRSDIIINLLSSGLYRRPRNLTVSTSCNIVN